MDAYLLLPIVRLFKRAVVPFVSLVKLRLMHIYQINLAGAYAPYGKAFAHPPVPPSDMEKWQRTVSHWSEV